MQILSGLATFAFIIVGAVVGVRLLWLGQRTKALPERSVGLALLLIGGIGYPLAVASGTPGLVDPVTGVRMMTFGTFVIDVGFIGIVLFTWSVFRRDVGWARALVGVLAAAYVVHAVATAIAASRMTHPSQLMSDHVALTLAGQVLNTIAFGWTAFEAYRYWFMLRRRAAIGLGDPVTTNRFLLWAMAATASLLTNAISWWVLANGIDFFASAGVQVAIGLLSVASCSSQYLAFLPPKAYVARLQAA
jgi:hypothetical protein